MRKQIIDQLFKMCLGKKKKKTRVRAQVTYLETNLGAKIGWVVRQAGYVQGMDVPTVYGTLFSAS